MKNLFVYAAGMVPMLSSGVSYAQGGNMMNSGMGGGGWMGGYGGFWLPILVVIVVVGLAVWALKQKGK